MQITLSSLLVEDQDRAVQGPITAVLFEDTCGNLINLVQPA